MFVESVIYFLLRQFARWHQPRLAAGVLFLISRTLLRRHAGAGAHTSHRALVMARVGFFEDVEESFRGTRDFDVVMWPNFALKAFAAALLSPSLDHNYYLTADPQIEATKRAYRDFLAKVWAHFSTLMPVDVVLTGNFGYCAEREFGAVVEAAGTPFVALHKENVRPPKRVAYWHRLYKERRGPFAGRKVLVYNDIERELEIASMVAAPEKIVVTGMPRLDRIHRWRRQNVGATKDRTRPQVLFFAFARYEKLTAIQRKPAAGIAGDMEPIEGEDWGKLSWKELGEDSHRAMVELARRRPDISVIVKTKGQRRKKDDILSMLQFAADNMPPNLKIVAGGDPFELMTESRVVVGFNTTGLLEAIAAGKPVIVPWFGEAQDSAMRDHIIDLNEAVSYARTPEELIQLVSNFVDNPRNVPSELNETASRVLKHWVGNDDSAAGARVYRAIKDVVASKLAHAN
jgi:hypothetical protein